MPRIQSRFHAVLAGLGLLLYLLAFLHQVRVAGLPPDFDAGLLYPLRIEGVSAESPDLAGRLAEGFAVGEVLRIQDARGTTSEIRLVHGRSWVELLTVLLSGLLNWFTAVFLLGPHRRRPEVGALFLGIFLFGLAVVIGGVYFPRDPRWLGIAMNLIQIASMAALPALLVLLAFDFPRPALTVSPRRALTVGLAVLAAASTAWQGTAFHRYYARPGPETADALESALLAARVLLVGQVGAGLVLLVRRGRRLELAREKALLKWLLWGLTLGLSPYVFIRQIPRLLGLDPPLGPAFDRAFELIVPLILLFIVARYRFLDIDIIIRRSLIYGVLAAGLVALYLGLGLLIGSRIVHGDRTGWGLLVLGTGIVAGVSFRPLRDRIGLWVDRSFFKLRHNYRIAIRGLEGRMQDASSPEEVIRILDGFLEEALDPVRHAVVLGAEGSVERAGNLDAAGFDGCLTELTELTGLTGLTELAGLADSPATIAAPGSTAFPEIEGDRFPSGLRAADLVLLARVETAGPRGFVLLGPKRSGWRYVEPDLELLRQAVSLAQGSLERLHWVRTAAEESMERRRLAELDRLKSDFLSRVSHDLRTPLASIAWSTENLLDGLAGSITPEQREYLGSIQTSAAHLGRLVANLLEISRMEQGSTRLSPESTSLARVLETALRAVRPLTVEKRLDLRFHPGPEGGAVIADPDKLLQVALNLLDNAIKYSPPGGVIDLSVTPPGQGTRAFTVRDRGPGLGPDAPESLFERFRQGTPSPHASGAGFGLGLYVVKSLVQLMEGEVGAGNHPDGGAEFTVTLPLARGGERNP